MKNKIAMMLLAGFFLSGCSSTTEVEKDPFEGMVKVPETLLKTKSQIETEFEVVGLKVKFAEGDLSETAQIFEKTINKGVCDNYSDVNVEFISTDEKAGVYAKKGSTIVVPCAERDFPYGSQKNNEVEEKIEDKKEEPNTDNSMSESTINNEFNALNSRSLNLGDATSPGAQKILPDIYKKLEDMKKKMEGYIENPDSYTFEANLSLIEDYSELLGMYSDLMEETVSFDENSKLIEAQNKMLLTQLDLPEIKMD